MSAATRLLAIVIFSLIPLGLVGCGDRNKDIGNKRGETAANRKMSRFSILPTGYVRGVQQWEDFLACWGLENAKRRAEDKVEGADLESILDLSKARGRGSASDASFRGRIIELEKRLGIRLPPSYEDFLLAYQPSAQSNDPARPSRKRLFAPEEVTALSKYDESLLKALSEWPVDSKDEKYFIYGKDQDSAVGRTSYLATAVVIGQFGDSPSDLILLYPSVKSEDGEMETSILFHSGEFRAPLFAEMMRQLAYKEIAAPPLSPPYTQDSLANTCSGKIALAGAWWK